MLRDKIVSEQRKAQDSAHRLNKAGKVKVTNMKDTFTAKDVCDFTNNGIARVKNAFEGSINITFCGVDECMESMLIAYYVVVSGYGSTYKVTLTCSDYDDTNAIDLDVERM